MLAERNSGAGPRPSRPIRAAIVAGLGLASVATLSLPSPALAVEDGVPRLAIAVPMVAPAGDSGLLTAEALAQYTREGGLLDRQLDAVIDRPVAIGIDPMIIASIRILGTAAPATATVWLERLDAATNQTFPLTYADSDITLATQAGAPLVLEPEGFRFAIDPALFAAPSDTTPTPAPTADPDAPVDPPLPTDDTLVAWPYSLTGIAWPREGTVTAPDLQAIERSGFETTIVSSTNVDSDDRNAAAVVDGAALAVADDAVSEALRSAVASPTTDVTALVAAAAAAGADGPVLATMGRTMSPSDSRLGEVLDALALSTAVQLVPLSQAIGAQPDAASLVDMPQTPERVSRVAALLESDAQLRRFSLIAADPELLVSRERLQLLGLLSNAWTTNNTGWTAAVDDALQASEAIRSSVQVVGASGPVNLFADNNQYLPITVSNDLDQAVTVYVTLRPTTSTLAVLQNGVELVVPPASQEKVNIPVQSIANGEVDYTVTLTDIAGNQVGRVAFGEVNVQAGWETPIVIVLAVLVVLVFAIGIVRTIVRRRRERGDD